MNRQRPLRRLSLFGCALLALLVSFASRAQAPDGQAAPAAAAQSTAPAPRIGVVTMQPGEIFFERFGHDALVVADPRSGTAISYNFGYFDPGEKDFISRFVRGEMMYYLVALPLGEDLAQYRDEGRGASIQWLDLPPTQARALAAELADLARPENARYRYDYFTANCSTMVRDALDRAMEGGLQSQLAGRSRGNTYRSESIRLASPSLWMWLGFDLGMGPYGDQPLSRWQEAFVPMRLADSLRQVHNSEGRPLVQSEQELLPQRVAAEPAEHARYWWPWLLAGGGVACLILSGARRPRLIAGFALPFWLLCTLFGLLLACAWGFTAHQGTWANRNLLLLNPLCVVLLPGAWRLLRSRPPGRWFSTLLWLVTATAALALPIHWLSFQPQFNVQWIVLLLPIHASLAWTLGARRLPAGARGRTLP
ncbi:DUF4105 domain-containing protein [Stenotrophomonas sp. YIM B06876]|uniref:lipoprotein N-acyltransferase Lnb domain-containing protein n=1 Tax=Stenotrophomonas sp. YIM B06876 TaxID=3060211 RepID=UPI0027383DD1|nr:DUF4105 domain-containing protein [Stenotrophomonas sp. YIM B06876]